MSVRAKRTNVPSLELFIGKNDIYESWFRIYCIIM